MSNDDTARLTHTLSRHCVCDVGRLFSPKKKSLVFLPPPHLSLILFTFFRTEHELNTREHEYVQRGRGRSELNMN